MSRQIEGFEDLELWQVRMRLTAAVHKLLKNYGDFSLRDQISDSFKTRLPKS